MIGTVLHGRYRLDAELGRGGMGTVYRAHDTLLDRDVAVKVVGGSPLGTEGRARLLAEARAVARLNHPGIVSIYDAGQDGDMPFIVMELLAGRPLVEEPPADWPAIVRLAQQLCAALEHAHAHGIVHRDLKPENVWIVPDPAADKGSVAKLMDFGLARSTASRLTSGEALVGTVFYLAPEQALGREVDGRADLYALGVMLYELAAGRLPFSADDPLAVVSQHLHAPVVPPHAYRPDVPPALEAVILRLLAKRPEDRYPSARAAAEALAGLGRLEGTAGPLPAGPGSLLEQLSRGRLIGRRAELERLRGLWAESRAGHGRLALISGEPGIGKTRLARELMVSAQLGGAAVMHGGCYEYEMGAPYLPFAEALRAWVRAQDDRGLGEHLGAAAPELARLAPEIDTRLGPLPPNPPLSPEEERLRLFDYVARFFRHLAAECSLLLFLDDLQWADQGTLSLLRYLLRTLKDDRLLILAAYRETDLNRAHPLAAALVEWNRERLAIRLPLGRLDVAETGEMLAALFGEGQVTDEFAAAIHRETEGNPFFIEEVVKTLIEQGQIYREDGRWERLAIAELAIPQSVKEAIGRRLNRQSPESLAVLHTAAALGRTFSFRELAAVAGQDEDRLLDILDEVIAAQLVRAEPGETFAFTHDKIREVLYEELNPVRRRRLHLRIGAALETLFAGSLEGHVEDLAYHFVYGGDQPKALRYLRQAADGAARLYAHDQALAQYEQALELAEALNAPEEQAAIHEAMARAYVRRGPIQRAVEHYEQALALVPSTAERARIKARIGVVYAGVGDERGSDYLQAALDELDPATQPTEVAWALAAVGRFHHYQGQHGQALALLERARELAEPHAERDPSTLTDVYAYLMGTYQHLARFEESMAWAWRGVELAERMGFWRAAALGYEFMAEDCVLMGRWQDALKYAALDRQMGERIGSQTNVAWSEYSRAQALLGLGELEAAAQAAQVCAERADAIGELRLGIVGRNLLALAQADLARDEAARATAEQAAAQLGDLMQIYVRCTTQHALAYLHCRREEWAPAAALYEQAAAALAPTDNRIIWLLIGSGIAEALWGLGRLDEALRRIESHLEMAADAGAQHLLAIGQRVLGQIRGTQEQGPAARDALDRAIAMLEPLGSRLELGRALYWRSRVRRAPATPGRSTTRAGRWPCSKRAARHEIATVPRR